MEDPTPNLQRVREKLEVEMLSAQPWVLQQAEKVRGVYTYLRRCEAYVCVCGFQWAVFATG